ncbi:hypothetical protein LAZ67_7002954 [Cordylochernes scorpioides]|uniref:Transposase n=1 Tax=Cordylochernes scorpioides TaxID=51811 RepID=A0ABY6KTL3_9ARAC|nr:hypothetical protein LAZ67_7002954 [Cordylochernes scorpioides]
MERSLEQRYAIKFCSGKWHKAFKEGREEVADEPRSGRPTTSRTDENVDRVLEVLRTDRRLSIQQITDTLHMSTFVVHGIVTEDLQMRKVCAKLVPKVLTQDQKELRVLRCQELLDLIKNEPDFLNSVVTGDESWMFEYDPESKRQSCAWHTKSSPRPKKARMSKSRIKTIIIGQTVNSVFYLEVLRRLKRRIARMRTDIKDTVKVHHDNATSHTAFITNFLARSNTSVILHPPYSPDLAPCDLFLFPRLKREMKGKHWETVENIQHHVTTFLRSIPFEEFQGAFQAWQTRLRKVNAVMDTPQESKYFSAIDIKSGKSYPFALLEKLGLPSVFLGWISVLYGEAYVSIQVGDVCTKTFPHLNGMRQGCHLSAALFSIREQVRNPAPSQQVGARHHLSQHPDKSNVQYVNSLALVKYANSLNLLSLDRWPISQSNPVSCLVIFPYEKTLPFQPKRLRPHQPPINRLAPGPAKEQVRNPAPSQQVGARHHLSQHLDKSNVQYVNSLALVKYANSLNLLSLDRWPISQSNPVSCLVIFPYEKTLPFQPKRLRPHQPPNKERVFLNTPQFHAEEVLIDARLGKRQDGVTYPTVTIGEELHSTMDSCPCWDRGTCNNCPVVELTPTHIFSFPAIAKALQKIDMDPEQQFYTPKIVDIMAAIAVLYGEADASIQVGDVCTKTFPLLNGMKQGCRLSAALFVIRLWTIAALAHKEGAWILNISKESTKDLASGSSEALAELLDQADLVDFATFFDAGLEYTRVVTIECREKLLITEELEIARCHRLLRRPSAPVIVEIPKQTIRIKIFRNSSRFRDDRIFINKDYSPKIRDQRRILNAKGKELLEKGTKVKLRDNRLLVNGVSYQVKNGQVENATGISK